MNFFTSGFEGFQYDFPHLFTEACLYYIWNAYFVFVFIFV